MKIYSPYSLVSNEQGYSTLASYFSIKLINRADVYFKYQGKIVFCLINTQILNKTLKNKHGVK